SSFDVARRGASAGVTRQVNREVLVSGTYQLQRTQVFNEKPNEADTRLVDRVFPRVRLSSFLASAVHDTRNDVVDPATGHYFSASGQLAARRLGSEVGFSKTFLTAQGFYTPPNAHRIVLAGSARIGLADAFRREVAVTDGETTPQIIEDLPASERFYAGGDTT